MSEEPTLQYTFASPEWLACFHGFLLAGNSGPGVDLSISHCYTNVPPGVNPAREVGWTVQHRQGKESRFFAEPSANADVFLSADWAWFRKFARTIICVPGGPELSERLMKEAMETGKLTMKGQFPEWPNHNEGHDRVARFTK